MKASVLITANTTGTKIGNIVRPRELDFWAALMFAYGTWGSGTLSWYWSPDNGTTLMFFKDLLGGIQTSTANDSFNTTLQTGKNNTDRISAWVALSGATTPSLTVGFYDAN